MSKPLIAVTAGKHIQPAGRSEIQSVLTGCNADYVHSVIRSGGAPLLIPRMPDLDAVRAIVEAADGVMLTGGGDVVSLAYGEERHFASK